MKIEIEKFKAFKNNITIDIEGKNLITYGENGAGKSSIYEAFKILFFKHKLEQQINTAPTPEEQEAINIEFWSKYNNKFANDDFILRIDDTNYRDFNNTDYQVFMISLEELKQDDNLQLDTLLKRYFFDIANIDQFCSDNYLTLQTNINNSLVDFNDNITITIDNEDDFRIKIVDTKRNIERKTEIRNFFNEAKLNLVTLLLLFHSIKLSKEDNKTQLLILDDFITSLDVSNRTYILKYIFDNFPDFKVLIFTHNISFYNLIMYFVNDIYKKNNEWIFTNLYEINNQNKIYFKNSIERVNKLKEDYDSIPDKNDITQLDNIGNRIRQKFEILLYEFSKLLMVGAVEDSKKIIERIENSKNIYFLGKKTASDLIDEIISILNEENHHNLSNRLQTKINSYRKDNFNELKKIIKNLKLYQKVTMHPMSHGSFGQSPYTTQEIIKTIDLLGKLEKYLKELVDEDVT